MESTFSPGIPVAADVAAIDRELGALWESASQHEGKVSLIRACAGNLIVLAGNQDGAGHLLNVLPGVAQQHPLRSLLAYWEEAQESPEVEDSAPPVRAWISAQCSLPVAGGPQVCSEVITLAAADRGVDAVTNLLASILIPDLPVYIYLPSFTPALGGIVARLAAWANILILDSRYSGYSLAGQPGFAQLISSPPAGVPARDLEWARLTAWRDLVSQFFDAPETRSLPYQISRVEIAAAPPTSAATSSAALLFAGWLASRLDWSPRSAALDNGRILVRCNSSNGEVLVSLEAPPSQPGRPPRIESVALHTRTGRTFAVTLDRPTSCLAAAAAAGDTPDVRHAVPDEELDEANLLVRELSITGEDPGFQEALGQAIAINGMLP
jgi:glucose-6-phosphate dehydrogenase assembly protein OpcA